MTAEKPKTMEDALRGAPILIISDVAKLMGEHWDDMIPEIAKELRKGKTYKVAFEFEFKLLGEKEVGMRGSLRREGSRGDDV